MKEIKLSETVVLVLHDLRSQTREPQEKINSLNIQFQNIITAICLQENLNFEKQDVKLSDDLTTLIVTPKETEQTEVVPKPTKSKIKKM